MKIAYPVGQYTPDISDATAGVVLNATNFYPSTRGARILPRIDSVLAQQNGNNPWGGFVAYDPVYDGDIYRFIGLDKKIKVLDHPLGTYYDVTRVSGGDYNAYDVRTWSFTQMGNKVVAASKLTDTQIITIDSTAQLSPFVNISGAPKAEIVITAGPSSSPFIVAFNYTSGSTDVNDGFFNSALSNPLGWTPGTNQCSNGQLIDTPGEVRAAVPYRDGWVAFKENSMYMAQYVGDPLIWQVTRIASEIGCVAKNAVAVIDDMVYFIGRTGLFVFDGSYPRLVAGAVNGKIQDINRQYMSRGWIVSDAQWRYQLCQFAPLNCLLVVLPDFSKASTTNRMQAWWFNYRTQKWLPNGTIDNDTVFWVNENLILKGSWDFSPTTGNPYHAAMEMNQTPTSLPDNIGASPWESVRGGSIDFGWMGDDIDLSTLRTVIAQWVKIYPYAKLRYYGRSLRDSSRTQVGSDITIDSYGKFDLAALTANNYWHSVSLVIPTSPVDTNIVPEIEGIVYDFEPSGALKSMRK